MSHLSPLPHFLRHKNLLGSWKCPWTPDPPFSTSQVLGLQALHQQFFHGMLRHQSGPPACGASTLLKGFPNPLIYVLGKSIHLPWCGGKRTTCRSEYSFHHVGPKDQVQIRLTTLTHWAAILTILGFCFVLEKVCVAMTVLELNIQTRPLNASA